MPRTGPHGGERIGDRVAGIVMRVDAKMRSRHMRGGRRDDGLDLMRERSAIGIAEDDPAGSSLISGLATLQRVSLVGLETVEEMLAVEQRLAVKRRTPPRSTP